MKTKTISSLKNLQNEKYFQTSFFPSQLQNVTMADNNNNGNQEEQTNIRTDSNLPILFANGYPTSLEKMSGDQLELFIPFLIKCSKDGSDEEEATVPKWWPSGIEYKIPLEKPKNSKKVRGWMRSCGELRGEKSFPVDEKGCLAQSKFVVSVGKIYCERFFFVGNNDEHFQLTVTGPVKLDSYNWMNKIFPRNPRSKLINIKVEGVFFDGIYFGIKFIFMFFGRFN